MTISIKYLRNTEAKRPVTLVQEDLMKGLTRAAAGIPIMMGYVWVEQPLSGVLIIEHGIMGRKKARKLADHLIQAHAVFIEYRPEFRLIDSSGYHRDKIWKPFPEFSD